MGLMRIGLNEWIFCAFEHDLQGVIVDERQPETPLYARWGELRKQALAFSMRARGLIWPLATAAESEVCPTAAKLYIIDRLKELAYMHELDQAREAAMMLEEGIPLRDW
ncbi:uncharacterized protein Z520_04324 [Fonsecaea multimorphosa CBS 102226]|uniref:Uncharacterized protein n=1 Tax=Fonsecaea multimorphosa CBS 102226 TaxID=1442371 RepID=A0A0D2K903_9EURO|nr:uncharacterized protein Z520_04324 [Fonsecaea multimorphosa CBS 102226]KIX99689.1 hypothetical protein Z520_04324 [Fonsecaea multimorphosa CBS 102226]OAL26740.1 hypothetical protein AYO22_04093 [Fonsecaea multimorphosa]